jgi:hypothetical protein
MSEIKTNKISPRTGTTQTIGDSGDTLSIACGTTLSNAGTISTAGITGGTINNSGGTLPSIRGVIEWDTTAKTSGFTAVSNTGYFCNTTSSTFTVTFPASPTAGDVIGLKDYANTFDTNKLSIDPNGNNIQGSSATFECTDEGAALQFIYVDATRGWVLTDASKASDIAEAALFITATGGCVSCCGDYKIHTFTGPGTFTVTQIGNGPSNPAGGPSNIDYLVVAGGGGAGSSIGGGGGAGGQRTSFPSPGCNAGSFPISTTTYPITVGAGGSGGSCSNGTNGNPSIFSTITSAGGGGGAIGVPSCSSNGVAGGSGGGGSGGNNGSSFGSGGSGNTPPVSPPQGNTGGNGGTWSYGSAGGGGSGAVGSNGGGGPGAPTFSGPGGNGISNSITGSSITRGGGGGGGSNGTTAGTGGSGGGGAGAAFGAGTAGTANTGGGGGGSAFITAGASGGSGIVIIRYKYQ